MPDLALLLNQSFIGLSVASILLLAALGLAFSFGVMRVINMAHGELLMIGGYLAFLVYSVVPNAAFLPLALPFAFLGGAALGAVMEVTIVRRLYGRPLDTLLATWGVGLILQQAARDLFGATGVEVRVPAWLRGAFLFDGGLFEGLSISYVRVFIIVCTIVILVLVALLLSKTRAGLYIRAVNQNREMAESLGVNTRYTDLLVFSLGSGLAGLAGAVFALLAPITPTVGQSYIVNAFLVVILGGLGSLIGTSLSSGLVGSLSVLLQTFMKTSLALVAILVLVVAFLQIRPRGLVATRSRNLDEV